MPALTDARLAQLAKRSKEYEEVAKLNTAKAAEIKKKILTELLRRGARSVDTNGIKLTVVAAEVTNYDYGLLAEVLPTRVLRSIQKQVIDPTELAHKVQDGTIDAVTVAQCSTVTQRAPYLKIT